MNQLKHYPQNFVDPFARHLNLVNLIGLDLLDDSNNINFKKYGKFFTYLIFLYLMVFGEALYIIKGNEINAQFLELVSSIPNLVIGLHDCLIAIVMFLKRNKIRQIIMKIGEIWPVHMESEDKIKLLNQWTRNLNFIGNSFYSASIICLIFFELEPLAITIYGIYKGNLPTAYQFPVQMYLFGILTSHYTYALIYMYQCVIITLAHMALYVSCAVLLVDLTYDLSALLNLLKIDLENLVLSSETNFNFEEDDSCEDIKSIVVLHEKLLSIAEDVNAIFGFLIFVQVTCASIVICCYGFMAMVGEGMILKYLTATLGILFGTFFLSWPGQVLANTSFDIANAAYQCHWYERGKIFRQYIVIIIARSQTPCYLSALGFSNITLAMFTKITSTSWSYLSLLNQMYENSDF